MTATIAARRLQLRLGEVTEACRLLGLRPPPGFDASSHEVRTPVDGTVHPSLAATLAAVCAPRVGVVLRSDVGSVRAVIGVRGALGGSLLRAGDSTVELSTWRPTRLGVELARAVPALGRSALPPLRLPLGEVAASPALEGLVVGTLHATVIAPPAVLGMVVWLATESGWLTLEPAESIAGVRWAEVRPVEPADLGVAVAPLLAAALS